MPTADDYVEVFRSDLEVEALRIVDVVLRPNGIEAVVHDRVDRAFPASGQPGSYFVAVPEADRERAEQLIGEFEAATTSPRSRPSSSDRPA